MGYSFSLELPPSKVVYTSIWTSVNYISLMSEYTLGAPSRKLEEFEELVYEYTTRMGLGNEGVSTEPSAPYKNMPNKAFLSPAIPDRTNICT